MEEEVKEHALQTQNLQLLTDHEAKLLEERAESNPSVRKSSRPRKQSKRVLDSVDCNDIELLGIPMKKKQRRELKLKIGHKKDILPNGRPFKCSLCESPYINNSPAKAKIKKELQPIMKEKFGQLLQLCVKCAIAVNHTENKGPTPEQRAEFEEEGRQFAQHVVEYLNDSAAARLYCSFYQTTKCGCIQCYITGTPAGRKRKTSLSGVECAASDITEPKLEDGVVSVDEKAEQAQRARYLLGLLKESMAKKQTPNAKKSNEKLQLAPDDTANTMKESEKFILENRVKLKELGICERGCQKVLCYSNNFLHKKSVGSQPRLQRTRGRAALGRLHALQDLHKMRCCEKCCVRLAERNQAKMALWRQRAQQGQKEMWKVLEEMLTSTEPGKTSCFKFISMVTGCCLTTVQKVYADVLLSKGAAGCASKREHGMRFHWKRQKELGKRGQSVTTALQDQPQMADPRLMSHTPVTSDTCLVPTLITNQAVPSLEMSEVKNDLKFQCQPNPLMMSYEAVSSQAQPSSHLCGNIEDKGDKEDIKEKFLQFFENMKDPQEIANVQEMLAKLQRDLLIKQEKESDQQRFTSQASAHVSASETASLSSSTSTPLSFMLNSSYAPTYSSSATSLIIPHSAQDQHVASIHTPKQGRPFVNMKVQQTIPELKTSVAQIPQLSRRKQRVSTTSSTGINTLYHASDVTHSAKDVAPHSVDTYTTHAETLSSQLLSQPLDLSNLTTHPGADTAEPHEVPPVSLSLGIISNAISPFVVTPHVTVSSMTDNSLDLMPQQVSLFQVMAHPGSENSHLTTQASQILSVYPQPTPLQIQPFPLSTSNNAQHIQFQLISPLILGQSDLMIPLNQAGTMSFILPKQSANDLQNNETFLQALPLSCSSSIGHKDSIVNQMPIMQQSFQNIPAFPQTLLNSSDVSRNKLIPDCTTPVGCNVPASKNSCNINNTKQDIIPSSQSLGGYGMSDHIQSHNLSISFDQVSGPAYNTSSQPRSSRILKSQYSHSSANTPSITVMNFQGIQNTGQGPEAVHQVTNNDHYFPSSLLGQASGNIVVETPSSCSSGSFVFDALADSPVKDSLSLPSPSLHTVPVVTSSLLCEMLMRSLGPTVSSISSPNMQDFVPPVASSFTPSRSPTHCQSSPTASSTKSSLLISALKSTPLSSTYCQSLNFNTHTTPSTMSNQPMVMTGKVEQTNFPVAVTIGHSTSLAHSQMGMSRLSRQREPPQVGIVHPHISGVKGGSGHTVNSAPSSSCNSSIFSHNSAQNSSASSYSMNHANPQVESLLQSSSIIAVDSTGLQVTAPVQDITADIPAMQSYPQQQHVHLSLLLNSQQAASLTDQPLINTPQLASQFNMTALLGNSVINTASLNEDLCQNQSSDSQKKINTNDCNVNPQNVTTQGSQYVDRSNILHDQTHVVDQASVSIGSQNIILGNTSSQQHTEGAQFFQSVTTSNTGQLKLIPLILSGTNSNSSAPNIFSQNGQLLVNMNHCSGLGSISSLSPQIFNRDNSIFVNMSPNSSQNMQLLQVVGSTQSTSSLPLPSPNIQNIHQSVDVSVASKDQATTFQFNVLPLVNSHILPQSKSQTNSNEFQNTDNIESQSQLPTYTLSGPVGPVAEVVHTYKHHTGQSLSESNLVSADTSKQIKEKKTLNFQSNFITRVSSSSSHSVFSSASGNIATVNSSKDIPHKAVEVVGTSPANLSKSTITTKNNSSNLTQTENSGCHKSDSQTEEKHQISQIQVPHAFTESTMQHHQLPLQVLSMDHAHKEQAGIDGVLPPELGTKLILGPSSFQSIGLGQQLHSVLNISSSNQIFLPLQSIPFNRHIGTSQTNSTNDLQLCQQLSDLHTIFLPTQGSSTANDASALMSVVELTKNVNTHSIGSSVQTSISNAGLQHTNTITSCASTSKHRPIRPKLLPVPTPAPKISLMLVPDKSGCATYQLTQLDQPVLPFQQISEQKEKSLSQVQFVSQEPQNAALLSGTSHQSLNTILVPETSQQQQNSLVVAGNPQEPQNALIVAGTSQKQRPTAIMTHLLSDQQANIPAQILLVSEPHHKQEVQNLDKHTFPNQHKEPIQYPSQQTINSSTLPVRDFRYKSVSQQSSVPEILLQQSVALQPNQSQLTTYERPEMPLLQSGDLKANPPHGEHFQIIPSQNKEYKMAISHDRPVFIDSLHGDSFPTETLHSFEVSNGQSSRYEVGLEQCGSLDVGSSQIATSHLCSLPSGSLQNDIQGFTPQVTYLKGKQIEMIMQQQHLHANSSIGHSHIPVRSSNSPTLRTAHPALKVNQYSVMKGHDTRLDTASTNFLVQSKLIPDNSFQPVEDKNKGKASLNVIQPSSQVASAIFTSQTHNVEASHGLDVYASFSSNIPPSNAPVSTTQMQQKLTQPSTGDMKNITSNGDVKPLLEPVQYLQCKEVIDLTDDSPPLSPSINLQNRGKILGLYPILTDQSQPSVFDDLWSLLLFESHKSNQQGTSVIPLQIQRLLQANLPIENLHVNPKLDQLKQEWEDEYKAPNEIVQDNIVLMTSLETPTTGQPTEVQFESRIFSQSDDLSYCQAFLSSKVSPKQTEDHLNFVTKEICKNTSPNPVITISANQQFPQSIVGTKLQEPSVEIMSTVSNSRLNEVVLVKEDSKRLTQTAYRSNFNNINSKLPSLSVVGTPVTHKQLMDLSSRTQSQSRCSSEVAVTAPPDQSASYVTSSSLVASALTNHKFQLAASSSSVLSTPLATTLPSISAVRTPAGRIILHPLTSSTVAFVRTTSTPTDAVGPPNITIMSPAQASSSPLLRFHHDTSSVSVTTAVLSHVATSTCSNPLSTMTKGQGSGLLKLTGSTTSAFVPVRIQGSQDTRDSALLLCPGSGGRDKVPGQSARRLSLENTSQAISLKEVNTSEMYSPSLGSKSTDSQIKSIEPTPPSKPRSRKRQSTVMDLLKNKEKLQATASAVSSCGLAMNSTPGPVTLMISGAAGSSNLLVMDSSTGQPRVDSNTLNITVKNLQLLGKLTINADKTSTPSAIPPSSHSSGFTILQPNILQATTSRSCTTSAAVVKESSTVSLASMPSSLVDSHIKTATNTTSMPPTIYLPVQKVASVAARSSPFLGHLSQPKLLSEPHDVFNQVTLSSQSSTSHSEYGNQGIELLMPGIRLSTIGETSTHNSASIGHSSELKHKHTQEIRKSEAEVQLLLIGQPQVASSSYKDNPTAIDFLSQKPQSVQTESSYGKVCKFKTTKSSYNEDRNHEIASFKFQLIEDSQKKQLTESTGTPKKFLLLNDKLPGSDALIKHPNSALRPSLLVDQNAGQISAEQKKLSLKSPQLLQLMKNKHPFSPAAVDQSASHEKSHQLKLPTSSVGMPSPDDNAAYSSRPSNAVHQVSYHPLNMTSQQRDQLPALKIYPTATDAQLRGIKAGLVGADNKDAAWETSSDTRRNLLPSQNPLLANILFTSISGGNPTHFSSVSVNKSSLYCNNQTKTLLERRGSSEEKPHMDGSITLGSQTSSSKQFEDQKKTERLLKCTFEEPFKATTDHKSGANKAPFKATSDSKSELNNAPPAYSQPPRYEVATKDMTRVNRVIEDIYKFPDEGEESSPPPAFVGWKSQVEPQKLNFVFTGSSNRKSSDSPHESSISNLAQSPDSVTHFPISKSNIKSVSNTDQGTSGNSVVQQGTRSYHLSESFPSTWRNIKKLRHKKERDKMISKCSLKKVQFSDVVTSKSASEYGQSITVSSHTDAVPCEVSSNYPQDAHILKSHHELSEIQHQQSLTHYLSGQHQSSAENRQDSQAVCGRHPCVVEQLQTEPREYKKACHAGQIETSLAKVEATSAHPKDMRDKTSDLTYIQREEDKLSSSDFEAEDNHGRESHRVLSYQLLPKVNHRVSATTFVDCEQESKRRDEDDTGPVEAFRHIDDNQYPFQSGFVLENIDNISSLISDKTEAHRMLNIQNALKSSNQTVLMEAFRGMNKCDDMAHGKAEGSFRDLTKRKLIHDESFQFSTGTNHGTHLAERKHYMTDKEELLPLLTDSVTGNNDRDPSFDQQSSFNILSTQGYSKLSRQRLNRTHCDQIWVENSTPSAIKNAHFTSQGLSTSDTSCSSDHFDETREFPQQTRCDSISASNASSAENMERQSLESPLIRQKILETNFELARQMKKGRVQILKDSRCEDFEVRKLESPQKFIVYPERKLDGISSSVIHRGTECQMNKELEYRTLSGPDSVLTSPTFLTSLDGRPDVLSSIESYSFLRKEIKGLRGENHYLKLEVAKAEQKEKEQQRQRQLSSSDKQKGILIEAEKSEKIYYTSPSASIQAYMVDVDSVMPPRKRHSSSTTALGILNCSPLPVTEQNRPEEGFLNKSCHSSLVSCGIQPILESDNSFPDGSLRGNVSGSMYTRSINNIDDYSLPENYIKDIRDPFVSSSMSGHSRPNSHLELGIPQYESTRNRYPSSEMKPVSSRGISDGDGFAPLQEHTRHRNLSSSLGIRALFEDPPPYDITQRQRNPSASSLKSTFQDAELPSLEQGARSRNPSSSSWLRYWDYAIDSNFTAVRSRNPSGSSNRRSRPGSSSSDRELPVNMDEFPMFSEFNPTRSRNSSGESIEPTVEFFLDPQQFMQYTYPSSDAHIKRTKH